MSTGGPAPPFRHCPACTAPATPAAGPDFRCRGCGFHYFHNVAAATAAFILCADEVLVTVRARPPAAGTLDLPGGFVTAGESLEQGLARELAEELGLDPLPAMPRYLFSLPNRYPYDGVEYATSDAFFAIDCADRPLVAARQEIADIAWHVIDSLDAGRFGLPSVADAVRRVQAALRRA